ncbi:hypothetical protein BKA82DRAFT_4107869 [Pisolithus tinctorius]|nr:hypothetical protein BKA82DRAFT_4107869 [Pisolithus tinctorius]
MLSASHFTGTPPVHPLSNPPGIQVSAAHSVHSHHHFSQEQQHGMSTGVLPTPPSSPAAFGLHPIENTLSLLESLVAFYHQERMWVYRTRAQLEMDMMQRVEEAAANDAVSAIGEAENEGRRSGSSSPHQNTSQSSPQAQSDSQASQQPSATSPQGTSPSPPTKWLKRKKAFNLRLEGISTSRGGLSRPRPYPPHRPRQGSSLNPAGPQPPPIQPPHAFYPPPAPNHIPGPATTTLTSPYLCHPSFATTFGPPSSTQAPTYSQAPTQSTIPDSHQAAIPLVLGAGGREPCVQVLEMFEKMMQARMESCERVSRMVRSAANLGASNASVSGPVGAPGLAMNMPTVSGPVGGPGIGGPVGLTMNSSHSVTMTPMGVVPTAETYASGMMQGTVYGTQEQEQSQTQDFPMGVAMG